MNTSARRHDFGPAWHNILRWLIAVKRAPYAALMGYFESSRRAGEVRLKDDRSYWAMPRLGMAVLGRRRPEILHQIEPHRDGEAEIPWLAAADAHEKLARGYLLAPRHLMKRRPGIEIEPDGAAPAPDKDRAVNKPGLRRSG